jgi:hypothetical protein
MATFYIRQLQLSPLFLLPFLAATCYYPNGSAVDDAAFQPCAATSGAVSMCCATNRISVQMSASRTDYATTRVSLRSSAADQLVANIGANRAPIRHGRANFV